MLCVNRLFLTFLMSLALTGSFAHAQVDLHAHLHMKPGLGFFLQGSFSTPPTATQWKNKIFTRVSQTSLADMNNETRPKLIVLSLYAHPYLSYSFSRDGFHFDRRENVRRAIEQEYQEFKQFVDHHADHFAIARNAGEARRILKDGKTVIVLSLEGAWATLESPEDFHRWIEERGLAIVTPVHLTPDSLGGNSLMTALISFTNSTGDFLNVLWKTHGSCLRTFCKSAEGFTKEGAQVVDSLMKNQVWVDLAHSNELEVEYVIKKYETGLITDSKSPPSALPLLITHTQLREFYPVERGLGKMEIEYIRKHEGIVGLLPSQYMMPVALKDAKAAETNGAHCVSGLDVFKKTLAYAIATLGTPARVALASDINAPLDGLSPDCGTDGAHSELQTHGFYTYSQWNALTKFVAPDMPSAQQTWANQTLEHFLLLWEKVRPNPPIKP